MAHEPDQDGWLPPGLARRARWLPASGQRPAGRFVALGGRVGHTAVTLRLVGEDLDPAEVSTLLGCQPSEIYRGRIAGRDGTLREGCCWLLRSTFPQTQGIDAHVRQILARVTPDLRVWQRLARFRPDMFVGLFLTGPNQGDTLSAATMKLLAERGIALEFDIYSAADDDDARSGA